MKIILDAMGGDFAPEAPVLGAIDANKAYGAQITLVGRGEEILEVLKKHNIENLPEGLEIAYADEVVDMHDDPANVIRKKKNSSMVVGLRMLTEGQGDAFVSAGSTGALLSGATLIVKRVKGIRRAAMAPSMPTKAGTKVIICDCGANAECTPEFLLQFGLVASMYAKKTLNVENPRVGLLNIGAEDTKGTQLQLDAYALLTKAHEQGLINFVGNVEARGVPLGDDGVHRHERLRTGHHHRLDALHNVALPQALRLEERLQPRLQLVDGVAALCWVVAEHAVVQHRLPIVGRAVGVAERVRLADNIIHRQIRVEDIAGADVEPALRDPLLIERTVG